MRARGTKLQREGTYALLFRSSNASLRVGALGEVRLTTGFAVYVGSAFGAGGLAGRLRHHLQPIARPRWHLDYLRPGLDLRGAWVGTGPRHTEHAWASIFSKLPNASLPRRRLGTSDCRCSSHFFHWPRTPGRNEVVELLTGSSDATEIRFLTTSSLEASVWGM
jgi:Uri superfamily endonuclease